MTTNDKIYYISESILKNGTRKREQGRGREDKTEGGRKKETGSSSVTHEGSSWEEAGSITR